MVTADQIRSDRYRSGRYLRRWALVEGFPRCVEDALDTGTATAEEIAAVEASNAAIYAAMASLELYETALALTTGRIAPPPLLNVPGIDGETTSQPNPALAVWDSTQEVIAAVTPETLALVKLRKPAAPSPSPVLLILAEGAPPA